MKAVAVLLWLFFIMSAKGEKPHRQTERVRYVAIGDSYSIGEGASPNESWPAVLTRHLNGQGLHIDLVANLSRTGWTTRDAIDLELPLFLTSEPNFATLLIGVNDWVQGVDETTFRKNFVFLLDQMLSVLPDKKRLLVVTIPDFGVTPTGPRYARGRDISKGIGRFNEILTEEAKKRSLTIVDVFPLSREMGKDKSLVASDGLHPSAKEYAEWEEIIFPAALELLRKTAASTNH
jgi:lysophospholipase L1-like esterase